MTGKRIDEIHAFVAIDPEDDVEGITAYQRGGYWMPMVSADQERVDGLKTMGQLIATRTGQPVRLVKFSVREELEVFEP